MRKIILLSAVCCLLSAVFLGCDKLNFLKPKKEIKEPVAAVHTVKGTIIAKVNNLPITLEDLNQEIDGYNAMVPADRPEMKISGRDKKIEYLKNELVRRTILYQAGLDRGLDRNEDILKAVEKTKMDLLVVELIKQEAEKVNVGSKEIEDYYNTYKEQLREPEEKRLREIVVSSQQPANEILIQLLQGGDFATLARERSIGKSAKDGGDIGFVQKGKSFKEMDSIMDALDIGQTSSVFKGPEGYYIIKVEAKRGGQLKSLNEMWDDIKRGLTFLKQQQQIEELISRLSRQAKIEIYEGEIK